MDARALRNRFAWLALALCACTSTGDDPKDGGAASTARLEPGAACSIDGECRDGLRCHASRKVCICTADDSCPGDLKCQPITGLCSADVPGCKTDGDCNPGEGAPTHYCEEETRVCRPLRGFCQPCSNDDACGEDNRCVGLSDSQREGFCGQACDETTGCPLRTHCDAGQCVPDTTCEDVVPCTPDTFQVCSADADCTEGTGQFCDTSIGQCRAGFSGCGFGLACERINQTCVPICAGDVDCQLGERCLGSICTPITQCVADSGCASTKICRIEPGAVQGECVNTCRRTQDCPLEQTCTRGADNRYTCRSGCSSHADCAPNELCDAASGTCKGGPNVCQINEICGSCQVCGEGTCRAPTIPYCKSCRTDGLDSSCGPGGICTAGACAPACPETGCPKGSVCTRVEVSGDELRVCFPSDGSCSGECT